MKLMLIGSGGREHALAWKLASSPKVDSIVAAPGNPGIGRFARNITPGTGPRGLLELARAESPDLVVIGPEAPLVAGLADALQAEGIRTFGPGAAAARLEGSKAYSKEFMRRHGVPTAEHQTFGDLESALGHLRERGAPVVIKDSALAAGKGVTVADHIVQAEEALARIFTRAGASAVIEDRLQGQEISYLVFTDGTCFRSMPIAQDYKQAEDGDKGPMTGGMGAVAPVDLLDDATRLVVETEIVERTLSGLRSDGVDYRGVLYFGLMLTSSGPKLLEYNVRFGDPETQVVLPLLETDLVDVFEAVIERRLADTPLLWSGSAAACVVMAAPGYPGDYRSGIPLGLPDDEEGLILFQAGTSLGEGRLTSSGGRVLNVVAQAAVVPEAVRNAYRMVRKVDFPGSHYRRDIGSRTDRPG